MIRMRGRPGREWVVQTKGYSFGAVIRLDDNHDSEFWAEIELCSSALREMLTQHVEATIAESEEKLSPDQYVIRRWQIVLDLLKPFLVKPPPEDTTGG